MLTENSTQQCKILRSSCSVQTKQKKEYTTKMNKMHVPKKTPVLTEDHLERRFLSSDKTKQNKTKQDHKQRDNNKKYKRKILNLRTLKQEKRKTRRPKINARQMRDQKILPWHPLKRYFSGFYLGVIQRHPRI